MISVKVRQPEADRVAAVSADGRPLLERALSISLVDVDAAGHSAARGGDRQIEFAIAVEVRHYHPTAVCRKRPVHRIGEPPAAESLVKRQGARIDRDQVENAVIIEITIGDRIRRGSAGVDCRLRKVDLRRRQAIQHNHGQANDCYTKGALHWLGP